MEILGAIDIGTNSFHLVVAKINSNKTFTVLTKDKEVVRLGNASNDMKYISEEAMLRGISVLKRFKLVCQSFEAQKIRAVATSATREALNRDEFIHRVKNETGIEIEVISGTEEARLIYLGALQALPIYNDKVLLIDIGGGSTEFLIGKRGNIKYANSIKLGAVRMTQKFFTDDKIKKSAVEEARLFVKGVITQVSREIKNEEVDLVVGTSGTITNIGFIIRADDKFEFEDSINMNRYTYDKAGLESAVKKILKAETHSDRLKIPGIDPKRSDIITAGAVILEQIFEELKVKKLTISNYALREGIIFDTISNYAGEDVSVHLSNVRYKSVISLGEKMNYDGKHAEQTRSIAVKIFDFLSGRYSLSENDEECLEAACLLHDIGYFISHSQHHKHSYYIIRNSELLGFNENEIELIANISRYHRKSHPKIKHENFNKLDIETQDKIRKLSGILRIADTLDRSHKSLVNSLSLRIEENTLVITVGTKNNQEPVLEIWGVNLRKELFETSFGLNVKVQFEKN
ncbi:MAG: Ppx/GppA family phosphatase [Bacteroidetes bacterium]|nr:Ppx/GppA family phosphatase [Bacteroidota bacterium]MBX7047106.1 Ppx/GppA family phosphatase [Ignavibacteria bacterium]